jgi:hypothetical protein
MKSPGTAQASFITRSPSSQRISCSATANSLPEIAVISKPVPFGGVFA